MKPLTAIELDVLKEIASISSSHASTSLSQLIRKPVKISMVHLDKMPIKDIPTLMGDASTDATGIIFKVFGDAPGTIVLLSKTESCFRLAEMLLYAEKDSIKIIDTMARSALKEMGNILVGSYLTALSDFSGINMIESTPVLMISNVEKIVDKSTMIDKKAEYVLVVETKLKVDHESFVEDILLILDPESFRKIFKSIVKKVGLKE